MLPVLLPALERHGRVVLDEAARAKLLTVGAASIDRLLAGARAVAGGGRRPAGFGPAVRRSAPVRTFTDWGEWAPGWVEVDFVAHGGTAALAQTLALTDVATGWTERVPVVVREAEMVAHAPGRARELFPFPLRGVEFDNDSLFMNDLVVGWRRAEGLEVTRSRARRKDTRRGSSRRTGPSCAGWSATGGSRACWPARGWAGCVRRRGNLFQPSFKLREKRREGARVIKRDHAPVPPTMRALAHAEVSGADKSRLRDMLASADPVLLLAGMRARWGLAAVTRRRRPTWRGSRRARRWRGPRERGGRRASAAACGSSPRRGGRCWTRCAGGGWRGWRGRWASSAVDALERLRGLHPGRFSADHLRTVRRSMKGRRAAMAREALLGPALPTFATRSKAVTQVGTELSVTENTETLGNSPSQGNAADGFLMSFDIFRGLRSRHANGKGRHVAPKSTNRSRDRGNLNQTLGLNMF